MSVEDAVRAWMLRQQWAAQAQKLRPDTALARLRAQSGWFDEDLSIAEITRAGRHVFGEQRAYIGINSFAEEPFEYGEFLDGLPNEAVDAEGHHIPPDDRPKRIVATGKTWREARRKLEIATGRIVPK
jgi:hypothetical protein